MMLVAMCLLLGPFVPADLQEAPITPIFERVKVADNSFSTISGTTTIGNTEFCIAPAFSDMLVPQNFVEKQGCSTVLANSSLYIINPLGAQKLEPLLANSQYLACPPIDAASSGLYELSTADIQSIINSGRNFCDKIISKIKRNIKKPSSLYTSNGITRYHTVQFYTTLDLVRYWHRVWRHASEQQMLRIVGDDSHPSVFTNLPPELTASTIKKYFRQLQCLDCAIGGLHLRSAPGPKDFVPGKVGAHWQIDKKKFSGKDGQSPYYWSKWLHTHIFWN
jgi:hypothetical protein